MPSLKAFEFVWNLALGKVVELLGDEISFAERCNDPSAITDGFVDNESERIGAYLLTRMSSLPSASETNLTPFSMLSLSTTSMPKLWFLINFHSEIVRENFDSRNNGALPLVSGGGFLEDIYSPTSDVYFCTTRCEALGNHKSS